jgi:Bacterial regulatory proteins, gntR family
VNKRGCVLDRYLLAQTSHAIETDIGICVAADLQVANHVTARIAAEDLAPGARLPAERDLAIEYGA